MITINHNQKQINIPNSWNELDSRQFTRVCSLIHELVHARVDLIEYKLTLIQMLTGYTRSRKKYSTEEQETINNNLFILAEMADFTMRPHYENPELLDVLAIELQEELQTKFPYQITKPEYRAQLNAVLPLLQYRPALTFDMQHNPLKVIKIGRKRYHGFTFDIDENGVLQTDLLAEEYADALQYYRMCHTLGDAYLPALAAVLYRPDRSKYDTVSMEKRINDFKKADPADLRAVFYAVQMIQQYLIERSPWHLLFDRQSTEADTANQNHAGLMEMIYSLSQAGYGSKADISLWNLRDLLNVQIKTLRDGVLQMRMYKMKEHEIAEKTGLSISQLAQL